MAAKFKEGDLVQVVGNNCNHGFELGQFILITEVYPLGTFSSRSMQYYRAKNRCEREYAIYWNVNDDELKATQ